MLIQTQGNTAPASPVPPAAIADMQIDQVATTLVQSVTNLAALEARRADAQRQMATAPSGADRNGIATQLRELTSAIEIEKAKIAGLKTQLAETRQVNTGVAVLPPFLPREKQIFGMNKDEFMALFIVMLTLPIVAAVTRRLWKRSTPAAKDASLDRERLARIEQAVEAVAIEVERIGESQRYQAKLIAEKETVR